MLQVYTNRSMTEMLILIIFIKKVGFDYNILDIVQKN